MKPMSLILQFLVLLVFPTVVRAECNVCHSKKPEMRRMHEALGYKDCFTCHGPTAKAFDRDQRSADARCVPCHKS